MIPVSLPTSPAPTQFDVDVLRTDFPILQQPLPDGQPLVYLDNGSTAQKPQCVIDKLVECYTQYNANVHRGVSPIHERVTAELERARRKVLRFIGAAEVDEYDEVSEILFTSGTTMSINLVAWGWGRRHLQPGDEILLNVLEHHANLVPWQQVARETGAVLRYAPLTPDGQIDLSQLETVLTRRTKLLAVTGMSNVLGTLPPIAELARRAHDVGALILVDGAQSVPHAPVNVCALGIDFLVFSGHKLFGPTGVGVLYARRELLDSMDPFLTGGSMIDEVFPDHSTFKAPPFKFEAGTPPIAEIIGLGAAIDYVEGIGFEGIVTHEQRLLEYAHERLLQIPGLTIFGPSVDKKGAIVSFVLADVPVHDCGTAAGRRGVAIRASHHCAMPLHEWLKVDATCRASFAFYNTLAEVDVLAESLEAIQLRFRRGR